MASPQRPTPGEPIGEPRKVDREVGGGVRFGWLWIWIWLAIIAFIVAIVWFGGWGWAGHGGWWWGHNETRALNPADNTLNGSGIAVLNATNKQLFIGQPFHVRNVPVQSIVNDHALWVGVNDADSILVILSGNNAAANTDIAQGNRVNVVGTIQKAPEAARASQQWDLSQDDVNHLEQQGAYVQATDVQSPQP